MTDQSRGGIYIVNPATGETEPIASEDLAAREARASEPAPVKATTRKPPEDLTNGPEN
jgi:hypothetical protein